MIVGIEKCPETGKEHFQGYCELVKKKTMKGIKKLFEDEKMHIEGRKGTQEQAAVYCKKEGNWYEVGIRLRQGARTDLDKCRQMALDNGMREVTAIASSQGMTVARNFLTYNEEGRDFKPTIIWLWGPSGVGKSRKAREMLSYTSDIYEKSVGNKWWDGYDAHEAVILDDFRDTWFIAEGGLGYVLGLLDRYKFQVEVKGGFRQMLAKIIIITSVKSPEQCYVARGNEDEPQEQFLRRIDDTEYLGEKQKARSAEGNTVLQHPHSLDVQELL